MIKQNEFNMKTIRQLLNIHDPIDREILALMKVNKLNIDVVELDKDLA